MSHDNCHQHAAVNKNGPLKLILVFTVTYMVAEFFGGIVSHSLSLIADAGHMATDAASLSLGLFAAWIANKPADEKRSYGYHRAEILAALLNGSTLIAITIWLLVEAWKRFQTPQLIDSKMMGFVAVGGLFVNLLSLYWLKPFGRHSHDNVNLHAVWLHIVSDALGSIAAMVSSILIWNFGWLWADAVTTILIAILIFTGAVRLVVRCVDVLLEAVPQGVVLEDIRKAIRDVSQVREVHDLHVWTVTNGVHALSAHVCVADSADHTAILQGITTLLKGRFGIEHSTVQLEPPTFDHPPLHT